MLKLLRLSALDRKKRLLLCNHLFFVSAGCLFVVHQTTLKPEPAVVETPLIAQALHYQPNTPPPGFDPEQTSNEEPDLSSRAEALRLRDQMLAVPQP